MSRARSTSTQLVLIVICAGLLAPDFFRRDDEPGFSFVYRQPKTPEEWGIAEEAKQGCPTESIGNDGVVEMVRRS